MKGRNAAAYLMYLAVRAGMPMPADPIVRRNCQAIQLAVDQADRQRSDVGQMVALLAGGGRGQR